MKFFIFSVKDVVAGVFSDIKLFTNTELALRWFNNLCSKSDIAKDLQLYKLGCYNSDTGQIFDLCVEFIQGGVVNE